MPSKSAAPLRALLQNKTQLTPKLERVDVSVPEWDITVTLQQMSARDSFHMTKMVEASADDGIFIVLGFSMIDPETGARIFPNIHTPEGLEECKQTLLETRLKVLNRLQRIALTLNSHGKSAAEVVRDAEDPDKAAAEVAEGSKKPLGEAATAASPSS